MSILISPYRYAVSGSPGFYQSLTNDHTKLGSSDLTGYPVLISLTDANLKSVSHGGFVNRTDGFDIFFSTTSSGSTQLPYERILYDPTTGQLIAWVQAASLAHGSDTLYGYLRYGDTSITTDQQNPHGVWDSNFKWVVHCDAPGVTISGTDSTSNANNLAPFGSRVSVAGKIYGALPTNAGGEDHAPPSGLTTAYAYSFWVSATTAPTTGNTVFFQDPSLQVLGFEWDGNPTFKQSAFHENNSSTFFAAQLTSTISANTLYLIHAEWDGTNLRAYLNGSKEATTAIASLKSPSGSVRYASALTGTLEELRLGTGAGSIRGDSWNLADFNSQNSPSTFTTFGAKTAI